jgi:transglutaminase/protease-like cytokinesis protein 3
MVRFIVIAILVTTMTTVSIFANDFTAVDNKILKIPASLTYKSELIAGYINSNFTGEKEKIRAIYTWITSNISYDLYSSSFKTDSGLPDKISAVLRTRKAVCDGYVALFDDLCKKNGIACFIIRGYTKKEGELSRFSHSWCTAKINGTWSLFDPTWGSGFIQNRQFVRKFNESYFMTPPLSLIKSHIPFDPMWQLLNFPITKQEFKYGKSQSSKPVKYFNYVDSISVYQKQVEMERVASSITRIEKNGIIDELTSKNLSLMKDEIRIHRENQVIEQYNQAVNYYNSAVKSYKRFIYYQNQGIYQSNGRNIIQNMIRDAESYTWSASEILSKIREIPSETQENIRMLIVSVDKLKSRIEKLKRI